MALSDSDTAFLTGLYQEIQDRPLRPGDPRYQPVYQHPGCEDPIELIVREIRYARVESRIFFSGFSGSGKTTELFRLRQRLEDAGYFVLYADAVDYVNPHLPIDIANLLVVIAGAFSDALRERGIDIGTENYWTRFSNWLTTTDVELKEITLKTGADVKLELKSAPLFSQRLASALADRIGDLRTDVEKFFEDGVKAIRRKAGQDVSIVFLFDSLERIQGSLSNERDVMRSVEVLFSTNLELLSIPYLHVVYTVPPWLKFFLPGTSVNMVVLPCIRLWENDHVRTTCAPGIDSLRSLVEKRFGEGGIARFFGPDTSALTQLIELSGGHFRDLLLLLRAAVLRADGLPVAKEAVQNAIIQVRSGFLPIALDDAAWLDRIERERASPLKTSSPEEISRLTKFLNSHIVLYLRNGEEWFDLHPLVRPEVRRIVEAGAGG